MPRRSRKGRAGAQTLSFKFSPEFLTLPEAPLFVTWRDAGRQPEFMYLAQTTAKGVAGHPRPGHPRTARSVPVDRERGRRVPDVHGVVAQRQVRERDRATGRPLTRFGQFVGPDAESRLRVVGVTAAPRPRDRHVGEHRVGHREQWLPTHVVGLEHDAAVRRVHDVHIGYPNALEYLRRRVDPDSREGLGAPEMATRPNDRGILETGRRR